MVAVHPNPTPAPTLSNYPCSMTSYCWFEGDVTAAMLVVKNKLKHFSPLGAKQNKNKWIAICRLAHPHSGSSSTWFLVELEFGNVGFWGEGKTGVPGEKPPGARERTNNKLNPHMESKPGFEPGPHWWEASALTTAPPLLHFHVNSSRKDSIVLTPTRPP